MLLASEKVNFRISTTDVELIYTESGGAKLRVDVQKAEEADSSTYHEVELHFPLVAELRCTALNFFELHHEQFTMQQDVCDTESDGVVSDACFYQIIDSEILAARNHIYDPRKRLNLKHYLVIGYDSYIEIIASEYHVNDVQPKS